MLINNNFMHAYSEEHDILSQPCRKIVALHYSKQILLATTLLQWYLTHGLVISHIYQMFCIVLLLFLQMSYKLQNVADPQIYLLIPVSTSDCDRFIVSWQNQNKIENQFINKMLNNLMLLAIEGSDPDKFYFYKTNMCCFHLINMTNYPQNAYSKCFDTIYFVWNTYILKFLVIISLFNWNLIYLSLPLLSQMLEDCWKGPCKIRMSSNF